MLSIGCLYLRHNIHHRSGRARGECQVAIRSRHVTYVVCEVQQAEQPGHEETIRNKNKNKRKQHYDNIAAADVALVGGEESGVGREG